MSETTSTTQEQPSKDATLDEEKEKLVLPIANNILNNVTLSAAFQVLRDQSIIAAREKLLEASDEEIRELIEQYANAQEEQEESSQE